MSHGIPILDKILSRARIKNYPEGQIVIFSGDKPSEVYIVKSGYVKVYDLDEKGNEKILSIVKPGSIMPYSFFSGNNTPNKWFYQTLCDSEIYVLDRETVLHTMQADASLVLAFTNNFSREMHELLNRISSMGKSRSHTKLLAVLKYLVVCLESEREDLWWRAPFSINHQFLADITGITRESCSNALKILQNRGVIRQPKHNVIEVNTEKLMKYKKLTKHKTT